MMLQSLKSKVEKVSQAAEERLNAVKAAIQEKLDENAQKKKKEEPQSQAQAQIEGPDDILVGWTMLGEKGSRNKSVEVNPDLLLDAPEGSAASAPAHADVAQEAGDPSHGSPPAQAHDGSLDDVSLGSTPRTKTNPLDGYESDNEDSHLSADLRRIQLARSKESMASPSQSMIIPVKSEISEETVGRFGQLSSAIIWNILSLLEAFDLCQLSRTSTQFLKLATNEFLWERLYIKNFRKGNSQTVDKALWYEQLHYGGYRSLYGTKLCEDNLNRTLRSLQNNEHNAVEWICKPFVSVTNFFSATDAKVLMLGLDGAGKTSILYKLVRDEKVRTEHTIGFNTENMEYKGYNFEFWDLEHKPKNTLEFWKTYFTAAKGIIFVVDGTAPQTLAQSRATLESFMADPQLSQLPLLVYVNKRDIMESMSTLQVLVGLNLHYLCNISGWHIQPCSTTANDYSLEEGLDWLCDTFRRQEVQRLKTKIVS